MGRRSVDDALRELDATEQSIGILAALQAESDMSSDELDHQVE